MRTLTMWLLTTLEFPSGDRLVHSRFLGVQFITATLQYIQAPLRDASQMN
jgi:hypothetical protein